MSIYCTGYQLAFSVYVPCSPEEGESTEIQTVTTRWVEVYFQHVPAHIGHEGGEDYYGTFLPPPVAYDPKDWTTVWPDRCVFVLDEDNDQKEGQRYTNPLLVLSGAEYEAANFSDLMGRIEAALEVRYGAGGGVVMVKI